MFVPSTTDQLLEAPTEECVGEIAQAISLILNSSGASSNACTVIGVGGGLSQALAARPVEALKQLAALVAAHPQVTLDLRTAPPALPPQSDEKKEEQSRFPTAWYEPSFFPGL